MTYRSSNQLKQYEDQEHISPINIFYKSSDKKGTY